MLQNGQEENRKNVKITLFPFIDPISKVVPSIAGNEISGAESPICNLGISRGLGTQRLICPISFDRYYEVFREVNY